MAPSTKVITVLLCATQVYAAYFGGIPVGPFKDGNDSLFCPPGTSVGTNVVWCCPTGTQFVASPDAGALCCPTSADCTNDLLNSGVQCADPSMTLWKRGGSLLCCPTGYYLDDQRSCDNTGSPYLYTTTAQSASLTVEVSSPSATAAPASGSAVPTDSASASATDSNSTPQSTPASKTSAPNPTQPTSGSGGATIATGSTKTSSTVSTSTSHAAAASLDRAAGGLGSFLAMCGMLLV